MPSLTQIAYERERQQATGDTRYASKGLYAFVLRTGDTAQQFPLVLNPEDLEYNLPFAAELTPMQEGGVVSEEGGIVIGEISIGGTTGFKTRLSLADSSERQGDPEFVGGVDPGGKSVLAQPASYPLSGHMHFWRLANRCFDQYSALKKNPATAHTTTLEFHSLKDDLHLMVVPRSFQLKRGAARERVTSRYQIRLAVVGPAVDSVKVASPDESLLTQLKNGVASMRNAVQSLNADIIDLTAAQDDIRRVFVGAAGVVDDVRSIVESANEFLNGTRRFLDVPATYINATAELAESAGTFLKNATSLTLDVKRALAATYDSVADGLDTLWTGALFTNARFDVESTQQRYGELTDGYRAGNDPTVDAEVSKAKARADSSNGRVPLRQAFGQGIRAGDAIRGRMVSTADTRQNKKYAGFQERVVAQGDTLQSLAAKYLGDPNEWKTLVVLNRLKPPYITATAQLPGTLHPGDRIVLPMTDVAQNPDSFTTGNPEAGGSQIDALLGTDIERVQLASGKFGWAPDASSGSTDIRTISGVPNLEQGLDGRLRTERGHNVLYPNDGMRRQVGNRTAGDDLVGAQFEARQQLLADKRVARIAGLRFTEVEDRLEMEANVVPLGFTSARTILRQLT